MSLAFISSISLCILSVTDSDSLPAAVVVAFHELGIVGTALACHDDDDACLVMIGAALRSHDDVLAVMRDVSAVPIIGGVMPVLMEVLIAGI